MTGPLQGIRVLDLTNVLAGPFCCYQLAQFGADVIKVEPPGTGDLARQLGADPALNAIGMGVSFLAQNAGKRSVTVNLKHDAGKELLKKLVKTADVLVENFRPGVMDRLGVGYEALKATQPDLVYCAISGFGQDGPWRARPAYDQIVQGAAGVMAITGDDASGPLRVGYPIADTVGGLTAAFAISAALHARPRGSFIDVSMLEALLSTMGWAVSNYLIAGVEPGAHGNENVTSAPSGAFETAEGLLNIAANKDEQWLMLARILGRVDLQKNPSYATREDRKRNRTELKKELEAVLRTRPARDWEPELNQAGVPAGEVLTVPDILAAQQVIERAFLTDFDEVTGLDRAIRLATCGVLLNGQRPRPSSAPRTLGADNEAIWKEIGISDRELSDFRTRGTI